VPSSCSNKINRFAIEYVYPLRHPLQVMSVLPLIFGLFIGGPQIAQEMESGTYRMVCTQSVTCLRWFAAKLAVPVTMTVVVSGVVSAAMTWWWQPVNEVAADTLPWYQWAQFDGIGVVPVGLSVLMLVLGVAMSLVLRRTVLAMGATLAMGTVILLRLESLRGSLLSTTTATAQHSTATPPVDNGWVMNEGLLSPDGKHVGDVHACVEAAHYDACMAGHGRTGAWAAYHPASQMWPLQWTEFALCVVASCALAAVCVWLVRRRA
jgi:hypothetical protein